MKKNTVVRVPKSTRYQTETGDPSIKYLVNRLDLETGLRIYKVVDHTTVYVQKQYSGSLIVERVQIPKWDSKMRLSAKLAKSPELHQTIDAVMTKVEVKEEVKVPYTVELTDLITRKQQSSYTQKYPNNKYRITDYNNTIIVNPMKAVSILNAKLPVNWKLNPYYIRDLKQLGKSGKTLSQVINYHITNLNTNYIVYLDPEEYLDIKGNVLKTKIVKADVLENRIKLLVRFKGLNVIFRTPKGDIPYITPGLANPKTWDVLNEEWKNILLRLIKYNDTETTESIVYNLNQIEEGPVEVQELIKYFRNSNTPKKVQDHKLEMFMAKANQYSDLQTPRTHKYSAYVNEYGFTVYENIDTRWDIRTMIGNYYLIKHDIVEPKLDREKLEEQIKELTETIKHLYKNGDETLAINKYLELEELEAKLSKEYALDDEAGYNESLDPNHIQNEDDDWTPEDAQYIINDLNNPETILIQKEINHEIQSTLDFYNNY